MGKRFQTMDKQWAKCVRPAPRAGLAPWKPPPGVVSMTCEDVCVVRQDPAGVPGRAMVWLTRRGSVWVSMPERPDSKGEDGLVEWGCDAANVPPHGERRNCVARYDLPDRVVRCWSPLLHGPTLFDVPPLLDRCQLCGEFLQTADAPILMGRHVPCSACPNECDGGLSVAKRVVTNSVRAYFVLPSPQPGALLPTVPPWTLEDVRRLDRRC
jgi:hypothetical protein